MTCSDPRGPRCVNLGREPRPNCASLTAVPARSATKLEDAPILPSNRRNFLGRAALGAGLVASGGSWASALSMHVHRAVRRRRGHSAESIARDEEFWRPIQESWPVDRSLINLNNGGVSPSTSKSQDTLRRLTEFANQAPAYNMWRIQEPQKENVRRGLARLFHADSEQIAIVRNATEALENAIFGVDLQPGDEILSTDQDYPRMVAAWKQRARREGLVFRQIALPTPGDDHDEIVRRFREALTPRTRVLHFSHVVFMTGEVLPVKALCALATEHGALSIVDGAHAFGHFDFDGGGMGCDYYGTSLHKWLAAPVGNGMLYVRPGRIESTWPLFAADQNLDGDIRKFEQFGTHPVPIFLSAAEAIALQEAIGIERKQERLRFLRERWASVLRPLPGVRFHTSLLPGHAWAIANVELRNVPGEDLNRHLFARHRIVATLIRHEQFEGLRIAPQLYTTLPEIDQFTAVMKSAALQGLPG